MATSTIYSDKKKVKIAISNDICEILPHAADCCSVLDEPQECNLNPCLSLHQDGELSCFCMVNFGLSVLMKLIMCLNLFLCFSLNCPSAPVGCVCLFFLFFSFVLFGNVSLNPAM